MEGLLTSWILAPVVLLLVCCGLALLLEWATPVVLPWTLRPALGMALMIVLAQLGTMTAVTAPWTLPAITLLGAAGWFASWARGVFLRDGGDHAVAWGLGAGALTFALYALPFFVRGEATWAGYIKLDDTATFMAMADWAFEHGRRVPEVALGSFAVTVQDNLGAGYPIGSFVGAALMGWLPGQDIAWTIQPGMAFGAAVLAMALYELGRTVIRRPALAAGVAVAATLSALLLGYYLWGGVKELAAAPLIALGPAIVAVSPERLMARQGVAIGLLLGVIAAALTGALGLGAGIWVLPIFLLLGADVWRRSGAGVALRLAASAAGVGGLLALPAIFTPAGFFNPLQGGLTAETELGNLAEPVSLLQIAGLWPALDFRQDPAAPLLVTVLVAIVCAAAAWLVWRSWREGSRGKGGLVALVLGGLLLPS